MKKVLVILLAITLSACNWTLPKEPRFCDGERELIETQREEIKALNDQIKAQEELINAYKNLVE